MIRRAWAALVAALSVREAASGLALFRIAAGAVTLYAIASMAVGGIDAALWVDAAEGGMLSLPEGRWLLRWMGGPTQAAITRLEIAGALAAAAVMVGAGGRVTMLLAGQLYLALSTANPRVMGGYDALISGALWLLFLSGSTATWSVDARLRTGSWAPAAMIPAWPRYLAIFQLLVVYGTTGVNKLGFPWTPAGGFSALYWVFQEPTWRRFETGWWAAWLYPLTQVATAITWFWEIGAPLLLVFFYLRATGERGGRLRGLCRRVDLRAWFAAIGVLLHVGILALLNVGPFSWISLSYYLCLWSPAEAPWRGWVARAEGRGGSAGPQLVAGLAADRHEGAADQHGEADAERDAGRARERAGVDAE